MISKKELFSHAKRMRNSPTPSEDRAVKLLRNSNIPYKRQVPFGFYILDFIVTNRLLVVEIDGKVHDAKAKYDKQRDDFCRKMGLKILRVKNEDVEKLITKIKRFKKEKDYKKKVDKAIKLAFIERSKYE